MVLNSEAPTERSPLLESYGVERRAVAKQNTLLSLSNYEKTAATARSLGLDVDHAKTAASIFMSSFAWLPKNAQKTLFAKSIQSVLKTFAQSQGAPSDVFRIKTLRAFLDAPQNGFLSSTDGKSRYPGGGLPLVFPQHDLGFSYREGGGSDEEAVTSGFSHSISIGTRLPHCWLAVRKSGETVTAGIVSSVHLRILSSATSAAWTVLVAEEKDENLCDIDNITQYYDDLIEKMRVSALPFYAPVCVFIVMTSSNTKGVLSHDTLQDSLQIPRHVPSVVPAKGFFLASSCAELLTVADTDMSSLRSSGLLYLEDLAAQQEGNENSCFSLSQAMDGLRLVIVRPDGHVKALLPRTEENSFEQLATFCREHIIA
jgi:hypothetical protein